MPSSPRPARVRAAAWPAPARRSREGDRVAVGITAEIKSRLPVADVVGESVQLRKAGTTLKGLCPFHGEKTPSFVVTPARDTWHCFGCGKSGDVFSFVMEREGLTFPEARRLLAACVSTGFVILASRT